MERCFDCSEINVYIFTEGGSNIGLGHLTRCIALYDELESRNLNVMFVINGEDSVKAVLEERRFKLGFWYYNWTEYLKDDCTGKTDCIIDSYIASEKNYLDLQKCSRRALYIDDTNRINYPSGIIVNPSIYGKQINYRKREDQIYLRGIEYIILRKEFQNGFRRMVREEIADMLVILGGSDIRNLTPQIISALSADKYQQINKHIVIGSAFTNAGELEALSEAYHNVHLYTNLNAHELCQLMAKSDLAITAAGQTVYELLSMKLPFICVKVIDNQEHNINGLIEYGMIEDYFDYCKNADYDSLAAYIVNSLERYQSAVTRESYAKRMEKINIGGGAAHIIDALVGEDGNQC